MTYQALYRQWRPRTFGELVGQPHVSRTLHNALEAGRIAHAYLFCGPRGTGKTSTAKILGKAVNCEAAGAEPCNACVVCATIDGGMSMDVIEIDAASNRGIDEIRELKERIKFSPSQGRYRVYIIDEVHMLTNEAFNALLKTLEEPPGHVLFVLATTEPHKVPLTVLSRCQRFDFRPVGAKAIQTRLREVMAGSGLRAEPGALELIARLAEGSLRDALGILDQAAAMEQGQVTVNGVHMIMGTVHQDVLSRMITYLLEGRAGEMLQLVFELGCEGKDLRRLARDLQSRLRQRLFELVVGGATTGPSREWLLHALEVLGRADQDMRWSTQPGVVFELALLRALEPEHESLAGLVRRIEQLEAARVALPGDQPPIQFPASPADRQDEELKTAFIDESPPWEEIVLPADAGRSQVFKPAAPVVASRPVRSADTGGEVGPSLELSRVRGMWQDVLKEIKRASPDIHAYLRYAWPVKINGNLLTLGFSPGEGEFFRDLMDSGDNSQLLSKVLTALFRGRWQINYICCEGLPPVEERTADHDLSSGEVISLFSGEEVAGGLSGPGDQELKIKEGE